MTLVVRELFAQDVPTDVRLRGSDAAECGVFGWTPYEAIVRSVEMSDEAWVMEDDGVPLVFGGYRQQGVMSSTCHVWMLGTEAALDYSVAVARMGRRAVEMALTQFASVYVNIAADNIEGIRWAEWLGFRPSAAVGPFIEYRALREGGR